MRSQFGLFLISFIIAVLFFGTINILQDELEKFFFWQELNSLGSASLLQPAESLAELKPVRNWQIEHFDSRAPSAIALFFDRDGQDYILYGKNIQEVRPIASLSKLMTALVAQEHYASDDFIIVNESLKEDNGSIKPGQFFTVKDLLTFALLASNNSAAQALTKGMAHGEFINLMNVKAAELGMSRSTFVNATGLDPDIIGEQVNRSTAFDLTKLAKEVLKHEFLVSIMQQGEATIYGRQDPSPYYVKNTNELLDKIPGIIFGKTGFTPLAKGCLLLAAKAPQGRGKIIIAVLGSDDRFKDAKELLEWVKKAYIF